MMKQEPAIKPTTSISPTEIVRLLEARIEARGLEGAMSDFEAMERILSGAAWWSEVKHGADAAFAAERQRARQAELSRARASAPTIYQVLPAAQTGLSVDSATVNQTTPQQVAEPGVPPAAGAGTAAADDPLRPGIFDAHCFDTVGKLRRLRDCLASAINMGEATAQYGEPQEMRINPAVKSEWYYILKAIDEAGVAKPGLTDRDFVEQMTEWFPALFPHETADQLAAYRQKLQRSISGERSLWRQGRTKEVVTLREMWAKGIGQTLGTAKAERVYAIAFQGLLGSLTALRRELERKGRS